MSHSQVEEQVQGPDVELVGRCRRGEAAAWRELYAAHVGFVYRTARRLGTPAAEVEDVAHEVFMVVFRKLDQFQEGRLTTWIYRICANIASDHHRRRSVRERFVALKQWIGAGAPETPERHAERSAARVGVERVLERMKPKKREVFALYELEGLSGEEIAERVGCPVDTVWTRLFHARREFTAIASRLGYLEKERASS